MLLAWQLDFPPSRRCMAGAGYVSLPFSCRQTSALMQELSSGHSLSLRHQGPVPMWLLFWSGRNPVWVWFWAGAQSCCELGQHSSCPCGGPLRRTKKCILFLFFLRRKTNNAVVTVGFGAYMLVQSAMRAPGQQPQLWGDVCRLPCSLSCSCTAISCGQISTGTGQAQGDPSPHPAQSRSGTSWAWGSRMGSVFQKAPRVSSQLRLLRLWNGFRAVFAFHNWSIVFPSLPSLCGKVELSEPFPGSVGWWGESHGRTGCYSSSVYLCQNFTFSWKCPEPRCRMQLQCTVAIRISVFLWLVMGVFLVSKERQAWVLSGWNNLAWTVWVLDDLFSWPFGQNRVKYLYIPLLLGGLSLLLQEWWLMSRANLSVL